jgi:ABC-type multidrug transport system fused ATPase/permease subunit
VTRKQDMGFEQTKIDAPYESGGIPYLDVELPGLRSLRWVARLIRMTWLPLVLAVLGGTLNAVLNVMSSSLLAMVITTLSREPVKGLALPEWIETWVKASKSPELTALGLGLALTIASGAIGLFVDWTSTWVHLILNRRLTPQIIETSVAGVPGRVALDASTAVQRWLGKTDLVYFLTEGVAAPLRHIVTILVAIAATYRANTTAGHASVVVLLFWGASGAYLTRMALLSSRRYAQAHETVGRMIRDGVSLRKDLSRPSLIEFWVGRCTPSVNVLQSTIFWQGSWKTLLGGVLSTIALALPVAAVIAASLTGGGIAVVPILLYLARLSAPLQSLATIVPWMQQNLITLQRILALTDLKQEGHPGQQSTLPPTDRQRVQVQGWSVKVGAEKTICYPDIELAGSTLTCVVGPSGSGKSTLLESLAGFREHASGHLLWNGTQAAPTLSAWREAVCLLPQEPELIPGTVYDNLDGLPGWRQTGALSTALKTLVAGIPAGMARQLTVDDKGVSVGQRRALCVVRALGSDAPILLLDEPAAGTDDLIAEQLGSAIQEARQRGKVVLLSCHVHDVRRMQLHDLRLITLGGRSAVQ